jgi:hypothetical protein
MTLSIFNSLYFIRIYLLRCHMLDFCLTFLVYIENIIFFVEALGKKIPEIMLLKSSCPY